MTKVFGRDAAPGHSLEPGLAALEQTAGSERFIAHNWRHDWRVSEPREAQALRGIQAPLTAAELREWYRGDNGYYGRCVCSRSPPEYLDVCNASNLCFGIARDYVLARALPLNWFWQPARDALPELQNISAADWGVWLDARVAEARQQLGFLGVRELLASLFRAWNEWGRIDRRPAFVASWADIEPLLSAANWPDRLRDALGMGNVEAGEWLAVIGYRVRDVSRCIRPTSLDADWTPYHFPSPPGEPAGITMQLDIGAAELGCTELIHEPWALSVDQWTGYLDKTNSGVAGRPLDELRIQHHARLRDRFGHAILAWMPTPV